MYYGNGNSENQYLVGDWDGDGLDNLAVRRNSQVLMNTNFDWVSDKTQTYGLGTSENQYLVGDWDGDGKDNIAVRRGSTILMDTNFDSSADKTQIYGNGNSEDEYLVGDWDGDGKDNIAVRRGSTILMDTNFDGIADKTQTYGYGNSEDEYLVGDWDGDGKDNIAVRRGYQILMDTNFDSTANKVIYFGNGNSEDDYLVGDWDGDGKDNIAVRRGSQIFMEGVIDSYQTFNGTSYNDNVIGTYQNKLFGLNGNDTLRGASDYTFENVTITLGTRLKTWDEFWADPSSLYTPHNTTTYSYETKISNDSLDGGNGNDTLIDHRGADTLMGGSGDDVFYVTANTDSTIKSLTGGSGADKFFVDIKGDVTLGLNFDAQRLANFINTITLPDQNLKYGELATNLVLGGLSAAGTFLSGGAGFGFGWLTSAISTGVGFGFGAAQVDAQKKSADAAVAEYGNSDWGTVTQTQRDLVKIKDFVIGQENIVLPSIADNSSYQYQAVIGAGGTFIKVKIGTAYTTDVLFIENQYRGQANGLDDAQFTGLISDLLNPQTGVIGVFKNTPIDQYGATVAGTFAYDQLIGKNEAQQMIGGYGDDVITGNGGNDVIYGGTKATQGESFNSTLASLYANDGNDILSGGDGNDALYGETGNDFLVGGKGQDTLTGGTGADQFLFNSLAEGIDTITDFKRSEGDKIHIDDTGFGATSTSQFSVNYATDALFFNGQQLATLQGIASTTDFNPATDLVIV